MVGIDEVGRGCLAGPLLVVAAKAYAKLPEGLADSKKLSRAQRESLYSSLIRACQFGEGWVTASEIDRLGLSDAMRLGVRRAVLSLNVAKAEPVTIDGQINYLPKSYENVVCIVGADDKVPLVSAASIYAKVRRDEYMRQLAKKHTLYGFENNAGYGTPQHLAALAKHGYLKNIHRQFFQPIASMERI